MRRWRTRATVPQAAPRLRYYRSTNSIISTGDTLLGTDAVSALSPNGTSPENLPTTAPNTDGTYWVGACVDAVSGESPTNNQCSTSVEITVTTHDKSGSGGDQPECE